MRSYKNILILGFALSSCLVGCSRQQSDWQKARQTNTAEGYEHFLKEYPSGEFTRQAQARLKELSEERDWQRARDADTSEAYQTFVKQHPEGKWTEEARIRVESLTLAQAPEATAPGGSAPQSASSGPPSAAPSGGTGHATAAAPAAAAAASGQAAQPGNGAAKSARGGEKRAGERAAGSSGSGSYGVQLGAFKSGAAAADKHWAHLQKQFPDLLAGLSSRVVSQKTAHGTLYRLQAVGIGKGRARSICRDLKAKAQACMVVRAKRG